MTDPNQREEAVFEAALPLRGAERAAYLAEACADDPSLRVRVEGLLAALERAGGLLDEPAVRRDLGTLNWAHPPTAQPGDRIGAYKLLQQIGEGGCGVVYMAEQLEPVRRRVALKIIKLGMDTKQVVARFEAERQALALMDHPNIAKVFDAGATEAGRPYFVMELVRGVRLTDYCDEHELPMRPRLELFIQVCQAVQHAHQKGIIHRDLKPSNILVTVNDGVPVPKVIDFGIAKATTGQALTDKTLFTAFEQFLGTPAYMSPEQALMTSVDIDTRSDIYSLGVLLYELLTGKTPFETQELLQAGLDEMRRTIREQEPARPSTRLSTMVPGELTTTAKRRQTEALKLIHLVRGDLDWIVMKCLEKDRARRYETANGLAADLRRHLNNEPVGARPPSRLYEFQKTVRRHKFGFAAAAALVAVLSAGVLVSSWEAVRATKAEREQSALLQRAEANEKMALTEAAKSEQVSRFLRSMLKAAGPSVALGRDATMLREILDNTTDGLSRELVGQPEVEADLRRTLGAVYKDIGDGNKAIAQYQQAARLYETDSVKSDAKLVETLYLMAEAMRWNRAFPDAEAAARRAVALAESRFGPDNTNTANAQVVFALVLGDEWRGSSHGYYRPAPGESMEAKRAEAEWLHRRALPIFQKANGDRSREVAMTLQNIASTCANCDEGIALTKQVLEIRREIYPEGHPQLAFTLNNLGVFQRDLGDFAAAETSLRQAWAIDQKLNRDRPFRMSWTVENLGEVLELRGALPEAERLFKQALQDFRQHWPGPSKGLFEALRRLVKNLRAQGKLDEAETLLEDFVRPLAPAPDTRELRYEAYVELIKLNDLAGRRAKAGDFCHKVLAVVPEDGSVLNELAWTLVTSVTQLGRDSGVAIELAQKAVTATAGKEPNSLDTLAAAYAAAGQFTNAVSVQKQAIAVAQDEARRKEFAQHLRLYETGLVYRDPGVLATSASALLESGEFAQAESLARECLILREVWMPDDWTTFSARALLGEVWLAQKKYADAEPWLVAGYEGMRQREASPLRAGKSRLLQVVRRLVQLCTETGRPEQAAQWQQTLAKLDKTPPLPLPGVPLRDPTAPANLLDLSAFYNAPFKGNWHNDRADNDLSELPVGIQELAGTRFDVRGLIQLHTSRPDISPQTEQVTGLPAPSMCRRVHFLHGAILAEDSPGTVIGKYIFHFADRTTEERSIVLGKDVLDWWAKPPESAARDGLTVAWTGQNGRSREKGRTLRLYKTTWENPRPRAPITGIDFLSAGKVSAPFLVAITIE
jgi:eukaryotic-like serine/threonine-protein kinase